VIYEVVDEIRNLLSGLLAPAVQETTLGRARVKEVFSVSKVGKVAGCEVVDGLVRRGARLRLIRDDVVVHEGSLGTLRHFKDDVREVRAGSDCGIGFESYQDIQPQDVIESYETKEVARTL
jgi:translation initiation factor IF-2